MTNCFEFPLHPDDLRWAAAEGVSEDVIAAVLLLHERSVDEIVPKLSAAALEQVIKLVGRSPRVYPPGTLEALKSKRNVSPTPMAESRAKKRTPSTARADHPLREQTRACRGFGTAAQQSTIEHASGAAASQNTAAVTDQPAARIKPDAAQMRLAHERRLAMLRAHTPQRDTEPEGPTGRVHFHEKPAAWPMAAGADMIAQSCAVGSGQSARLKPREPHCRLRRILNRRFTSLEMCNDDVC